jgi:hypothetical protein
VATKSFHTACQEDVYREVRSMLDELSDELFDDAEHCDFYLKYGTTVVEVSIDPYEEDNAVVEVLAYCVQGVDPTPDLMRELLRANSEVPMGAFSMVGTDIFFSHTFVGRNLQAPQLLASLHNVASTSDTYDEQIVARFGGETALERLRDWSRRTLRADAP